MNTRLRLVLATLALCGGVLAAFARTPARPLAADEVSALELAGWIRARRPGLLIVDARERSAAAGEGVPGARRPHEVRATAGAVVVVYGGEPTPPSNARRVLRLHGGIDAWNRDVMAPEIRADAPEREQRAFAARAALSRYFGGSPRVLDPGAPSPRARSRRGC